MNDEPVDEFGELIGTKVSFTINTQDVRVSDEIEFDASPSKDAQGSIQAFTWDFGDGSTASGEVVTHSYDTEGEYTVTLRVVDSSGTSSSTTQTIMVQSITTTKTTTSSTTEETTQTTDTATTNETTTERIETPGFGFGSALGALGGVGIGYLLRQVRSKKGN